MKFKKEARDKLKRFIEPGSVLVYRDPTATGTVYAVVHKVLRFGRDEFPELSVTIVEGDWLNRVAKTYRKRLIHTTYTKAKILNEENMRTDIPIFNKIRSILKTIKTK